MSIDRLISLRKFDDLPVFFNIFYIPNSEKTTVSKPICVWPPVRGSQYSPHCEVALGFVFMFWQLYKASFTLPTLFLVPDRYFKRHETLMRASRERLSFEIIVPGGRAVEYTEYSISGPQTY